MTETLEVGDLVFLLEKKGSAKHQGRARIVRIDGDVLHVIPLHRHRRTETVRRNQVRLWKAEKVRQKALRGSRGSRRGS